MTSRCASSTKEIIQRIFSVKHYHHLSTAVTYFRLLDRKASALVRGGAKHRVTMSHWKNVTGANRAAFVALSAANDALPTGVASPPGMNVQQW
jgi:hypothetical protein